MPIYAHYGVAHAWLVDPCNRQLETYDLVGGIWRESGRFSDADLVRAAPFEAVALPLDDLSLN